MRIGLLGAMLVLVAIVGGLLAGGCCRLLPSCAPAEDTRCSTSLMPMCRGSAAGQPVPDKPLFMYCGAAIRKPVAEISKIFAEETGIKIEPTFTGSGCLLAQIEIADKGDLFMPGEDWFMAQAVARGRIADWRKVAYFVPVIMVQRGNPHHITGLRDLLRPGLRVGIGEPKASAIGHFTVRLMEAEGIPWEDLERNAIARFATAPELGNAIKLKSIDACIQWDSIAALYQDDASIVAFSVTEETASAITLGVLKTSQNQNAAKRYLRFVAGPKGQAVFRKHHFTLNLQQPTFPPRSKAVQ